MVFVIMRSPLSVKPLLISPITSPWLLRICISALLDQVLSEQLVNLSELLPDVELRVTRDAMLLDEVGQSAVGKLRPAPRPSINSAQGAHAAQAPTLSCWKSAVWVRVRHIICDHKIDGDQ